MSCSTPASALECVAISRVRHDPRRGRLERQCPERERAFAVTRDGHHVEIGLQPGRRSPSPTTSASRPSPRASRTASLGRSSSPLAAMSRRAITSPSRCRPWTSRAGSRLVGRAQVHPPGEDRRSAAPRSAAVPAVFGKRRVLVVDDRRSSS